MNEYMKIAKELANIGAIVSTPDGNGEVDGIETLKEKVRVKLKDTDGEYFYKKYDASELKIIKSANKEVLDTEEQANKKELEELEKLQKEDSKADTK